MELLKKKKLLLASGTNKARKRWQIIFRKSDQVTNLLLKKARAEEKPKARPEERLREKSKKGSI